MKSLKKAFTLLIVLSCTRLSNENEKSQNCLLGLQSIPNIQHCSKTLNETLQSQKYQNAPFCLITIMLNSQASRASWAALFTYSSPTSYIIYQAQLTQIVDPMQHI